MSERKTIDLGLTGYDELFMDDKERADLRKPKVDDLPLEELIPFKNHPFKVTEDADLHQLAESIRESGVLVPALARPCSDKYELISGHRRLAACKLLGLPTIPVIIRELTDAEAIITMVDANLQRERILPSEKAFAYKMKMDALSHRGQAGGQLGHKSRDNISTVDSGRQIQRYIRLTNLIPEIMALVDSGRIALTPAVELSYLSKQEQAVLYEVISYEDVTPSLSQAQRMRRLSEEGYLGEGDITEIMREVKGNQRELIRIPTERVLEHWHRELKPDEIIETICKALDYYEQHLNRQRNRDER